MDRRRSRFGLSLVSAAKLLAAVWLLNLARHAVEGDLSDLHSWVERNGESRHIPELKGEIANPARIYIPSGGVDEQSKATE
jgi:hypothetical protein